ncbi:MAG: hypothetical protein KDI79_26160 [Anaerolineae bacterium]|nr:hypothetical protein [Anaerolineae bacterium]
MGKPAATVTVTLQDSNGKQTQRQYEARVAAITDAQAIALSDIVQNLTQLSVVDLQVTRRPTGFVSTAAEANSSKSETASLRVPIKTQAGADAGYYTFNLPALKAAKKSGQNVTTSDADILAFVAQFDNADGAAGTDGLFYVSDGEEVSELGVEGGNISGKINS